MDGDLIIEANQQATPTVENSLGLASNGLAEVQGVGALTVKGRGGLDSAGAQIGIVVEDGGKILEAQRTPLRWTGEAGLEWATVTLGSSSSIQVRRFDRRGRTSPFKVRVAALLEVARIRAYRSSICAHSTRRTRALSVNGLVAAELWAQPWCQPWILCQVHEQRRFGIGARYECGFISHLHDGGLVSTTTSGGDISSSEIP